MYNFLDIISVYIKETFQINYLFLSHTFHLFQKDKFFIEFDFKLNFYTVESAFLFRDRDQPITVPSLGVLNRP